MKTVEELNVIRDKARKAIDLSDGAHDTRIVVGMATCGLAAGARPVKDAFDNEIDRRGLKNVAVYQTGCIGVCQLEPVAAVYQQGKEKVSYVKLNPDMAKRIVEEHIVGGKIVTEYTIGAAK